MKSILLNLFAFFGLTFNPLFAADSNFFNGTIHYQEIISPEKNNLPVQDAKIFFFKFEGGIWKGPVLTVSSDSNGNFSADLSSNGSGTYKPVFQKAGHVFQSGDAYPIAPFKIPRPDVKRKIIAASHYYGIYGLGSLDELKDSTSKAASRIEFVNFIIPNIKVPNTVAGPCTPSDPKSFCLDPEQPPGSKRQRNNQYMSDAFSKIALPEFDVKAILDSGFFRRFSPKMGDPSCSYTPPQEPFQKFLPLIKDANGKWNWQISACGTQVSADVGVHFGELISLLSWSPASAISLDEETMYWVKGQNGYLADLYRELKQVYPTQRFFQWYTNHSVSNAPGDPYPNNPAFTVPNLPADGWIFDQYSMQFKDEKDSHGNVIGLQDWYPAYVEKMKKLNTPLVSILWAGPNWDPGPGQQDGQATLAPDCEFWNRSGWKRFYQQTAINRKSLIPTAYSLQAIFSRKAPQEATPSFYIDYMWKADEKSHLGMFYKKFKTITLPFIAENPNLPTDIPATRPAWIPDFSCN